MARTAESVAMAGMLEHMSEPPSARADLRVHGMGCQGCVSTVRKALLSVPGVNSAEVDLAAGHARVEYDPAQLEFQALTAAVSAAGYAAELDTAA